MASTVAPAVSAVPRFQATIWVAQRVAVLPVIDAAAGKNWSSVDTGIGGRTSAM